jgi:putative membrane protein
MQSVAVTSGPIQRMLGLASVRIHTVAGPISAGLPIAERAEAGVLFERLADEAVERAASDTSHHWGAVTEAAAEPHRAGQPDEVAGPNVPTAPRTPTGPKTPTEPNPPTEPSEVADAR